MLHSITAQSLLEKKITLDLEHIPLSEVLEQISKVSDITFSYSNNQIPLTKEISISVKEVPIQTVLSHIFANTDIVYKKIGNQLTLKKASQIRIANIPQGQKMLVKQKLTQVVRGRIVDEDADIPLVGVSVWIAGGRGTSTDIDGKFVIKGVPIGRQTLKASYLGYEPHTRSNLMVISAKEMVAEIKLREATMDLIEIKVEARIDKTRPLNELATTSARSFSVEETGRYAASILDPARMAMNFAGVSSGRSDDLDNQISVRGNSPRSNIWRMEGIEIPNPNHYSNLGGSGGGISMLSSSTLTYSDFYTGGFPAGFGNVLGGVFDINLRKGNDEKREYSFMMGSLGIEASAEGPMSKKGASYLFNYRYSTLRILEMVGMNPIEDEDAPRFQDLSFKFHLPTKKMGTFALFGMGGRSRASVSPIPNPDLWVEAQDSLGLDETQLQGTIGLSNRLLLSDRSYLHTVFALSSLSYNEKFYSLNSNLDVRIDELDKIKNVVATFTSTYTHKLNAQHTFRTGINWSHKMIDIYVENFQVEQPTPIRRAFVEQDGVTDLIQAYGHWKYRIGDKWVLNTGLHASYFQYNKNYSIEPRVAIQYSPTPKQSINASVGRYSKLPHEAFFFYEGVNIQGDSITPSKDLDMTKSVHFILGYDYRFSPDFRLKVEAYYQHLYNVPTTSDFWGIVSTLDGEDVGDLIGATKYVNKGKGRNYGIDLTLEKFFSESYYALFTMSLFESKSTPFNGIEYNTQFSTNYRFNLLGGKEFRVGKNKNSILAINGRFVLGGGARYTPIDLENSILYGQAFPVLEEFREHKFKPYRRFDIAVSYKINRQNSTHTFSVDLQNATNETNVYGHYYDPRVQKVLLNKHHLMIPFVNYRVNF